MHCLLSRKQLNKMRASWKHNVAAKNFVRPRKNTAEGGCGRNSAVFLQKIEASPAALLVKAKHHKKILFSLREKEIRRAQNEKSKEYFSVVRRVGASGGGAASLVGISLEKSSDVVQDRQPTRDRLSRSRSIVLQIVRIYLPPLEFVF